MNDAITAELVRTAYWLFLGRAPENEAVVAHCLKFDGIAALRDAFLNGEEFEDALAMRPRLVAADAPPLAVDWEIDTATATAMLDRARIAWQAQPARDAAARAGAVLATLRRNQIDPARLRRAFVFGDGRLRAALANGFAVAEGADLCDCADLRFGLIAPCDLWCSFDALDTLPPPLIARALAHAFAQLRPGGVAVFRLPVYGYGYHFNASAPTVRSESLPRHLLPQHAIFAIARAAGCAPLEVFEELSAPPSLLWRAATFALHKPRAD